MAAMGLIFIVSAVVWATATAQSNSNDCTNMIISMSPCLKYVNGTSATPASACCTQLRSVQPQCLCQVLEGGGSDLGLDVNQNQASALSRQCNVRSPPASQCNSGGGSKTVPSSGSGSLGAASKNWLFLVLYIMFSLLYIYNPLF